MVTKKPPIDFYGHIKDKGLAPKKKQKDSQCELLVMSAIQNDGDVILGERKTITVLVKKLRWLYDDPT